MVLSLFFINGDIRLHDIISMMAVAYIRGVGVDRASLPSPLFFDRVIYVSVRLPSSNEFDGNICTMIVSITLVDNCKVLLTLVVNCKSFCLL